MAVSPGQVFELLARFRVCDGTTVRAGGRRLRLLGFDGEDEPAPQAGFFIMPGRGFQGRAFTARASCSSSQAGFTSSAIWAQRQHPCVILR